MRLGGLVFLFCFASSPATNESAFFARHREKLMAQLPSGSLAVLCTAPDATVEGRADTYRQDSDFWYLTGLDEASAIAVLGEKYILFVEPKAFAQEQWTGWRTGLEGAKARYGADEAYPTSEFFDRFPELARGAKSLHFSTGGDAGFERRLSSTWASLDGDASFERPAVDVAPLIHQMRLVKDATEISLLRRAAELSVVAHRAAMRELRPGRYEYALKAAMLAACVGGGAARMAYPPIVGSGPNSVILHYERDDRKMEAGDMVVNDTACEYGMYAADVTRSYPVSGKFSPEQRAIYEIVLAAQKAGFEKVKPGTPLNEVYEATVRAVVDGLRKLGVLSGDTEEIVRKREYFAFYPHGSGHWLGLNVHDAGSYNLEGNPSRPDRYFGARTLLEPGMALTVEPGIYIPEGAATDRKWWNIGVRIEDDVLVTETGMDCLSCALPRELSDVEKALGK
jgi:Xaa-Pro aminopeptidase